MAKTYNRQMSSDEGSSFDLDLAPMLALMVTLIPILLLSTVFVQVVVIDTPLPQAVQQAIEEDRNKKERDILVLLEMENAKGFSLKVTVDGQVKKSYMLPRKGDAWDIDGLHKNLAEVKRSFPQIFRLDLRPGETVPYNDIVKVMDAARKLEKAEGKVKLRDKETNNLVETDVMFPDVVFANVVEG